MAMEGSASITIHATNSPSPSLGSGKGVRKSLKTHSRLAVAKRRRAKSFLLWDCLNHRGWLRSVSVGFGFTLAVCVANLSGQSIAAEPNTNVDVVPSAELVGPAGSAIALEATASGEAQLGNPSQTHSSAKMIPLAGPPLSVDEVLNQRGSITFRKTSLQEVVFLLSDLWNINIVAGEKVSGNVSGVFKDAPLRDVLSAILTSSGYGYIAAGNSLVVLPLDEVGTASPEFESRTLRFRAADTEEMTATIAAAQLLLSDRGRIQPVGRSAMLVVDNAVNIDRVESMLQTMRSPQPSGSMTGPSENSDSLTQSIGPGTSGSTGDATSGDSYYDANATNLIYLTPQYTEASEMRESLEGALGDGTVVAVFEAENRIMIKGNRAQLNLATQAFKQLDIPRAQVRITALIYDVGLEELEELGVNWGRDFRLNTTNESALADLAGNVSNALTFGTLGSGGTTLGVRTLTDTFDTGVLLRALDSSDEAKLLADPSITAIDRREASIKIVQQIPIVAAQPSEGSSNVVFAQVEFKDAGIILKVTPRISNDNTIELKVQPEYSVKVGEIENNPVIDSRTAETTVRVANGHMFTLGGLRQKRVIENVNGVPYLRDLKYVGKLFRSHATEVRESELIVFLKPEIISPYDHGNARSRQAYCVATKQLDSIPYASVCPQAPYCHDINCPNHHPRPRLNGGTRELEMLGGTGISTFEVAYPDAYDGAIPHSIEPSTDAFMQAPDSNRQSNGQNLSAPNLSKPNLSPTGSSLEFPGTHPHAGEMLDADAVQLEAMEAISAPDVSSAIPLSLKVPARRESPAVAIAQEEVGASLRDLIQQNEIAQERFRSGTTSSAWGEPLRADRMSAPDATTASMYPPVHVRPVEIR
ncbi:type II secretion system protein GspD [Rhodopirellula sp. JC740]|uniref:Type II secretion system protein GspD n=1 Tax=Rhodopirellula halodulae TaxID=2894198 RepID=A0ABS8NE36_9BACT|nr:secretin N-terminal domain-containing protein [Rhodopirellula sp. JC740]MCC9641098.1 type II secretion system protein GspD [Rhodopirellula sp. JC740]